MMSRSLRQRLVLTLVFAVLIVLGAVALVSSLASSHAFQGFLERELPQFVDEAPELGGYHDELIARWQADGSWDGAQTILEGIERDLDGEYNLVLVGTPGGGDVERDLVHQFEGDEEHVVILKDGAGELDSTFSNERYELPELELRDDRGASVGRLVAIPNLTKSGEDLGHAFAGSFNQWMILAALVAGLVAILAILAAAKRIVGPIEELTRAVRGMETGDFDQRLEVRSTDELGSLALAFNAMADSLQRSERTRSQMVGDVAHELRTPLTNVRCQLEAIRDGLLELTPQAIASLHEETLHLGKLVDDLQELSLAESRSLRLTLAPLDVSFEVQRCLSKLVPLADAPMPRFEVPELPKVSGDATRFQQVLGNLLSNARANTPASGEVVVEARARGEDVEISVRDTGRGIATSDLEHVFDRLYRTDPSRSRATGGTGLGLSIVKQLVEAQGGEVGVDSELGRGSRFWFTLRTLGSTQ